MPKGIYKRKKTIPLDRFNGYVKNLKNGCWSWQASVMKCGYGEFWDGEKKLLAHRWAYEHFIGKIPPGKQIDHLCRNRRCVNPHHLETVTGKENTRRGNAGKHRLIDSALIKECPKGHPYSKENTYWRKSKSGGDARECKTCKRAWRRSYYERYEQR